MDFITSAEAADKWNISQRRVAIYCKEGRIEGAVLKGRMWMLPSDAKNQKTQGVREKKHKKMRIVS